MRSFVAVEIPAPVRDAVGDWLDGHAELLPGARRTRREGLHLTLAFLGERSEEELRRLAASLRRSLASVRPFRAALGGGGVFPPRGRARVAWVGFRRPGRLPEVHAGVAGALRAALPEAVDERPFLPHVTVARSRGGWPRPVGERWSAAVPERLGEAFAVDGAVIFESVLGPRGSRYEALERVTLAAA